MAIEAALTNVVWQALFGKPAIVLATVFKPALQASNRRRCNVQNSWPTASQSFITTTLAHRCICLGHCKLPARFHVHKRAEGSLHQSTFPMYRKCHASLWSIATTSNAPTTDWLYYGNLAHVHCPQGTWPQGTLLIGARLPSGCSFPQCFVHTAHIGSSCTFPRPSCAFPRGACPSCMLVHKAHVQAVCLSTRRMSKLYASTRRMSKLYAPTIGEHMLRGHNAKLQSMRHVHMGRVAWYWHQDRKHWSGRNRHCRYRAPFVK